MADGDTSPRLRTSIDVIPTVHDGRDAIALRDPQGITDAVLLVPRAAIEVLVLLDGTRTLLDVQADLLRRHGVLVPRERLAALIGALEAHGFLEGPGLDARRQRLEAEFLGAPRRPAVHAGRAYAGEAAGLRRDLEGFFRPPAGPGPPGPPGEGALAGLVAPHIDFHRGGPAYAWAYRALAEASPVDCFVVLGTAHAGLGGQPFAATRKAYETPLGPLPVDEEVLDALVRRAPGDLFAAEAAHRREHSIEFQAVCIRYVQAVRGGSPDGHGHPTRFVPLLASFAHECLAAGRDPADEPAVEGTLQAIRSVMAEVPRRYCLVAGADLAHVGPQFGDREPTSAGELERVAQEDRTLVARAAACDAAGFLAEVARDGDRRRICGLSPIYALLRLLPAARGRVLHYGQWPDPMGTVTFASLAFDRDPP